jgi:sugar/nucleoside kinase (ribokinase family)
MAKQDDASLKRLGGGRWQTRDGRYTIESGSGRWVVVDAEQTNELGLPLTHGPFGSLTEAKAAIEGLRHAPTAVSPLEQRLAEARQSRARREAAHADGPVEPAGADDPAAADDERPERPPLVPPNLRRVLVIGHASWNTMVRVDTFPAGPASVEPLGWHETVGASGAGKAIALARLGIPVTLLAPLGNDDAGRRVRAILSDIDGLELRAILDPTGSARHVNLMDAEGGRQSFLLRTGDPELAPDDRLLERLVRAAGIVFLEQTAVARRCAPTVARLGTPIWADLHGWDGADAGEAELLGAADVVTMSGVGLDDPRPVMAAAIEAGRRLVVVTRGAEGAVALTEDGAWLEVPAAPVDEIVDANGAGDAFAAGLLLGLAVGHPPAEALAVAARAGALALDSTELAGESLTRRAVLG